MSLQVPFEKRMKSKHNRLGDQYFKRPIFQSSPLHSERWKRTRFPALGTGYMYLPRVLIGSLRCLNFFLIG